MNHVPKNEELKNDHEEYNHIVDKVNRYGMEIGEQTQTVMVGDHGIACAPEQQFGQTRNPLDFKEIFFDDQLAVAMSVEEGDDKDYQIAFEYDLNAKPPFTKNRRFRLYAVSGFCVCLAITSLILGTIILFREQPEAAGIEMDLNSGAIWEAKVEMAGINVEKWFVQFVSVVPGASNTTSIAHRAARWIISEDPMKLQYYAENLIQRYLLVLFYLTTTNDGKMPWRSCNEPKSGENSSCIYNRFNRVPNDTIVYDLIEKTSWLSGKHECDWVGNMCDENNRIRALHIMGQNITGTIPEDLIHLPFLQSIRLAYNEFTGTLPTVFASMRQLLSLEVHGNNLIGTFPSEYFSATLLQTFNILDNQFTGTISSEITKLGDLKGLHIGNNLFTGTIPPEIFNLQYLAFLQLQNNAFEGSIPTEVGVALQLQEFRSEANQLTGTLPSEIGLLNNLMDFRVSWNKLSGTIPPELYNNIYLTHLELFSNYFIGTLDPRISQLNELTYLFLSRNQFKGNLTHLAPLKNLQLAWLHLNEFEGSVPEIMCDATKRKIQLLQTDCFPLKNPPNPCPCCAGCCDRNTELCLIMDDDLKYDFF